MSIVALNFDEMNEVSGGDGSGGTEVANTIAGIGAVIAIAAATDGIGAIIAMIGAAASGAAATDDRGSGGGSSDDHMNPMGDTY